MLIQCVTNSFRAEMLQGVHDLDTDVLKLALYTGSANLYPTTTAYSATNEVVASGYTAGGLILTGVTITTGTSSTTQPARYMSISTMQVGRLLSPPVAG